MAFGWAGAASGASDALEDILTRKLVEQQQREQMALQQQRMQQQGAQFDASMGLQQQQLQRLIKGDEADIADRTAQRERQSRLDDVAAADRRQGQNQQGVRRMIGDFLVQRGGQPLDSGSRQTLQGMAIQEDVDLPADVTRDPEAEFNERKRIIDLQHRNRLGEIAATGDQTRQTQGAAATRSAQADPEVSQYAIQTATRTIKAIDDVLPDINHMTAGIGSALSWIPGSKAANVSAELSAVASNIAFNALQAMRDASKTGGALGQVSERELDLLSAVEGSIRQNQSPDNLRNALTQIKASMERVQQAAGISDATSGAGIAMSPGDRGNALRILSVEEVP